MAYFAKKTLTGFKEVSGGHSDPEAAYCIMTVSEYDKLLGNMNRAIKAKDAAEAREKINIDRIKNEAAKIIAEDNKKAEKRVEDEIEKHRRLNEVVEKLQEELEHEKSLNENLIRIATERANKARRMDKHDKGYLSLSWQPFHYKRTVKSGRTSKIEHYDLYKITVQTPWDCSLPEKQVDQLVMDAVNNEDLIISKIKGFTWYRNIIDLDTAIDSMEDDMLIILGRQYKSDGRTGLWMVTFITNFEPAMDARHRIKYV